MPGNLKDSMKSTWPTANRVEWNHHHWIFHFLDAYPIRPGDKPPVFKKSDKIPYVTKWRVHAWILLYAAGPMVVHETYTLLSGRPLNAWVAFCLYFLAFLNTALQECYLIRSLGMKHGFLDGDVAERDGIPDTGVAKVAASAYKTIAWRIAMLVLLTYKQEITPLNALTSIQWWCWAIIKVGCYGLAVDFWFYWYHRAMHEVSFLWRFHRTHHLTKHPNTLLGAYADDEQEFFDMAVIPFMAYWTLWVFGLNLGFYDWWLAFEYVAFSELMGHGGVRATGAAPSPFETIYEALGIELVVEDHDLHHRNGYRKAHNYGKQTRVWDTLFGTAGKRIEAVKEAIDYENQAVYPIFGL